MDNKKNRLATEKISKLLMSFAIPSVIANLVNAGYNIVDQIFIGQGVGYLGNAATNIAFPITTICLGLSLLIGIGASSNFNLEMGRGNPDQAKKIAGTAFGFLAIMGLILCIIIKIFLQPLMMSFGADAQTLPMAMQYSGITSFGIPFLLLTIGGNTLVRADGSSKYSMIIIISGAILNTILDPLFIFVFNFGIAGAAWATVISQFVSFVLLISYLPRFKSFTFVPTDFIPRVKELGMICKLGINSFIFQVSATIVQICTNNLLKEYGAMSPYGSAVPIAAAGITLKVNMIFTSVIIGIVQGSQPIIGYNYGAKQYARVRETFKLVAKVTLLLGCFAFVIFEAFAPNIVLIFGEGEELYIDFATKYLRIFLFFVSINGLQIAIGTFFPSIGRAKQGVILSLSKQIFFLLPLMFSLPQFFGVFGIVMAVPIADLLGFTLACVLIYREFKIMPKENVELKG